MNGLLDGLMNLLFNRLMNGLLNGLMNDIYKQNIWFKAQVGAALRTAFAPDMASHVTARACSVCGTRISSGVVRDLNDLKRVYQLLVNSLSKLKKGSSSNCYKESASTLEKL